MVVNQNIKDYIQQYILPQYSLFDKAHNIEHADKVKETVSLLPRIIR